MGLDTYAGARYPTDEDWRDHKARFGMTDEDHAAFEQAQAELEAEEDDICLFGGSYFRGSVVADLVRLITGVSLYRVWIPAETVRFMAEAFDDCDPEATIREYMAPEPHYQQSEDTIKDLRAFLRICAERRLGLVGSW